MGLQIDFNPSASATHAGMGGWAGPGGGAPQGFALGGPGYGYNPTIVAGNAPGVDTGNEVGSWPPGNPTKWGSYDMPIKSPTDHPLNPTSGWESFAFKPGQFNPFMNPYNIDNIVTPTVSPFAGYPNQIGVNSAPWINPFGSMFGGTGFVTSMGPDN